MPSDRYEDAEAPYTVVVGTEVRRSATEVVEEVEVEVGASAIPLPATLHDVVEPEAPSHTS